MTGTKPVQVHSIFDHYHAGLDGVAADLLFAEPRGINNIGEIVGTTFFSDSIIATLWVEGVAVDVNQRIAADDPLRSFVTLETAELINERSEIVATGRDSRTPNRINVYFLTPVL